MSARWTIAAAAGIAASLLPFVTGRASAVVVKRNGFSFVARIVTTKTPPDTLRYFPVFVSGPTSGRVDLVALAEGFTEGEMPSFTAATELVIKEFLDVEPFKSRGCSFNVWMVKLVSEQSGIDDPVVGDWKDTALDATFRSSTAQAKMFIKADSTSAVSPSPRPVSPVTTICV
jgi:hypothetical protein